MSRETKKGSVGKGVTVFEMKEGGKADAIGISLDILSVLAGLGNGLTSSTDVLQLHSHHLIQASNAFAALVSLIIHSQFCFFSHK